jgi:hypothetical protein
VDFVKPAEPAEFTEITELNELTEPIESDELLAGSLPYALAYLSDRGIVPTIEYALPRAGAEFEKTVNDSWHVVRVDDGGSKITVTQYPSIGARNARKAE